MPQNISKILANSCYDCHSNTTLYPWYAKIQPLGWLLQEHILEGKNELNFDEFSTYSERRKSAKMQSVVSQIEKEQMPLKSYERMHKEAKMNEEERKLMMQFFETLLQR